MEHVSHVKYCVIFKDIPFSEIDELMKSMGFIRDHEISREGAFAEYHYFWGDRQLHLRIFSLSESKNKYAIRAHTEPSIKTNPEWHVERFIERQAGDLREKANYGPGCRKLKTMLRRYRRSLKASADTPK